MAGRTIAIGDIHGCAAALRATLQAIQPTSDDTLVFLGDYVDRGPDSASVVRQVIALQDRCQLVPLMGNHEQMLLASWKDENVQAFWMRCGGGETILSYGGDIRSMPTAHHGFLSNCKRYHEIDDYFFVHANYAPDVPLREQPDEVIFWQHLNGSTPGPHCSGKTAVIGHTPQFDGNVLDAGHLLCIDTFCFGGGWLTALDVHSRETWQFNRKGISREKWEEQTSDK